MNIRNDYVLTAHMSMMYLIRLLGKNGYIIKIIKFFIQLNRSIERRILNIKKRKRDEKIFSKFIEIKITVYISSLGIDVLNFK